ncbi:MAG TPA: S8 family serine peptidase [Actinomycetota bacterium]|nr:S8 family serine peptidase [Actinomycetota bacterium]
MKIAFGISWNDSKKGQLLAAVGLTLGLLFASAPGLGQQMAQATSEMVDVIVRELPGAGSAPEEMVQDLGGDVGRHIGLIDGFTATVPEAGLPALESVRRVHSVTRDQRVHLLHAVDGYDGETAAGSLYQARLAMRADDTWHDGFTGKGVDVALIDSGVLPVDGLTYPGKVVNGPDLSLESGSEPHRYLDTFGHGTHMAGIIAGRDAAVTETGKRSKTDHDNFQGIAPDARILNVKVAASDGATDVSQVIAAIDWVVQHRNDAGLNVRVLNLSFGTDGTQSYLVDPLAYAAEVAWHKGIVVVVAAGNSQFGNNALNNPAYDPYVLAVGAADTKGTPYDHSDDVVPEWSARGTVTRGPDVVAPGKSVASLRAPGSYLDAAHPEGRANTRLFKGSGTSQAAAMVSGAAAVLLQHRPNLSPDQVKALLMTTATKLPNTDAQGQGAGLVNVRAAQKAFTPVAVQTLPRATGAGALEKARGTVHLVMKGPDRGCLQRFAEEKAAAEQAAAEQAAAEAETVSEPVEEAAPTEPVTEVVEESTTDLGDTAADAVETTAPVLESAVAPEADATAEPATAPAETSDAEVEATATTEPAPQASPKTPEEACPEIDHVLEGEQDIFGNPWDGQTWSGRSWSGQTWSGGDWNGRSWSGQTWSGRSWSGQTWSGQTWSGQTWSGRSWSGQTWSGQTWSGQTWSGQTWSGASWSGQTWSGRSWSGQTWSGQTWSGQTWSGQTWSGQTWSGQSWS